MRRYLIALILLAALIWWLWPGRTAPLPKSSAPAAKTAPSTPRTPSADFDQLYTELMSAAPEGKEPVPFKTKGRVRLKAGETAVIGFWQFGKNSNGLVMVKPEAQSDGTMQLTSQIMRVTDATASDRAVHDLFPTPFELDQYAAMPPAETKAALAHLQQTQGADMMAMPRVHTLPGQRASIQIGEQAYDGSMKRGITLDLTASSPAADGSIDLDLSLDLRE